MGQGERKREGRDGWERQNHRQANRQTDLRSQLKAGKRSNFLPKAIMLQGIGTCHKFRYMTGGSLNLLKHEAHLCAPTCADVCLEFEEHRSMFE